MRLKFLSKHLTQSKLKVAQALAGGEVRYEELKRKRGLMILSAILGLTPRKVAWPQRGFTPALSESGEGEMNYAGKNPKNQRSNGESKNRKCQHR